MTATETIPASAPSRPEDELAHVYCLCDRDIALCGMDVTDVEFVSSFTGEDLPCIVCLDLESTTGCPRCANGARRASS